MSKSETIVPGVTCVYEADDNFSVSGNFTSTSDDCPDNDSVNNPDHYQSLVPDIDIDCITAMRAAKGDEKVKAWLECNAFKYNWRFQEKGMDEDVRKAIWNLEKFLELGGCE